MVCGSVCRAAWWFDDSTLAWMAVRGSDGAPAPSATISAHSVTRSPAASPMKSAARSRCLWFGKAAERTFGRKQDAVYPTRMSILAYSMPDETRHRGQRTRTHNPTKAGIASANPVNRTHGPTGRMISTNPEGSTASTMVHPSMNSANVTAIAL